MEAVSAVSAPPEDQDHPKTEDAPALVTLRRRLGVLDQAELCALLGVDARTVSTWRTKGTGPAYIKVGNRVMYREEDVRRWLAQRVEQTPESKFGS